MTHSSHTCMHPPTLSFVCMCAQAMVNKLDSASAELLKAEGK